MRRALLIGSLLLLPLAFVACKKKEEAAAWKPPINGTVYHGHGAIQLFQSEGRIVVIKHEKIEGLMDAMTMGFELKDPAQGKALKVGDTVDFTLEIANEVPEITQIAKAAK